MGDISLRGQGKALTKIAKDLKKSSIRHLKQSKILNKMINKKDKK
jgi:hypothetical protein